MKTAGWMLAQVALLLLGQGAHAAFLPIEGAREYFTAAHDRSAAPPSGWSISLLDTVAHGVGDGIRWADLMPSNGWVDAEQGSPLPDIDGVRPELLTAGASFCDDSYGHGGCDLNLQALISYIELHMQRTRPIQVQLRVIRLDPPWLPLRER